MLGLRHLYFRTGDLRRPLREDGRRPPVEPNGADSSDELRGAAEYFESWLEGPQQALRLEKNVGNGARNTGCTKRAVIR